MALKYSYGIRVNVLHSDDNQAGSHLVTMFNWCDKNFGRSKWSYDLSDVWNGYELLIRFKNQKDFVLFELTWL